MDPYLVAEVINLMINGISQGQPPQDRGRCICGLCDTYNYYENANSKFKDFIGDCKDYIKYYNICSNIFFGSNPDFVGHYTEKMLRQAIPAIDEHMVAICQSMKFNERQFWNNIYVPILRSLHTDLMEKKESEAELLLQKYIIDKPPTNGDACCPICIGEPNGNFIRLPCGHETHYECTKTWFIENTSCVLCRAEVTFDTKGLDWEECDKMELENTGDWTPYVFLKILCFGQLSWKSFSGYKIFTNINHVFH